MNNTFATRIEQYLDGALSPEERAAFEAELRQNAQLAAEVRLHQAARLAVQVQGALERRARIQQRSRRLLRMRLWRWKVQDFLEDTFARLSPAGVVQPHWGRIALAGLSVLLLAVGLWWLAQTSPATTEAPIATSDPQALFQAYFRPVEIGQTLGAAAEGDYARARQLYAQGQCAQALPLLERALREPAFEARPMALLLQGACLLEAGRTDEAITALRAVPPTANLPYQQAEWYLALAHLKAGQRTQATEQLQRIAQQPRHTHRKEARALLGLN
ncbi:MAG: tetratricopeptide repeat protein [Saprospiraceae bacterium]|nr:tetratricopeptide repeat protein [Saprospiraceae bacterium]MDW8229666.1 tetratricopeptide repeat protein [Saprospiraceae bacterium]